MTFSWVGGVLGGKYDLFLIQIANSFSFTCENIYLKYRSEHLFIQKMWGGKDVNFH